MSFFLIGGKLLYNVVLDFCHMTTRVSHNYTYIPSLLSLPPPPSAHPSNFESYFQWEKKSLPSPPSSLPATSAGASLHIENLCKAWSSYKISGRVLNASAHFRQNYTGNRDQTHVPCIGRQVLNHWTTREVPEQRIFRALKNTLYDITMMDMSHYTSVQTQRMYNIKSEP